MDKHNIELVFKHIKAQDMLDDRREYDIEDLQQAYGFTYAEASELYSLIQNA